MTETIRPDGRQLNEMRDLKVKVGNLDKQEIGVFPISVRDAMNLWVLGNTFHHPTFGNYFAKHPNCNRLCFDGTFNIILDGYDVNKLYITIELSKRSVSLLQ